MKQILITALILFFAQSIYSQSIKLNEILLYAESNHTFIHKKLTLKGWKNDQTKQSERFKTYIWYYNGKKSTYNKNQIIAKYWFKKVYSNNSTLHIIDYQCKYEEYELLYNQIKNTDATFNGSFNDGQREYDTYILGNKKIDFIRYLSNDEYGVIISIK